MRKYHSVPSSSSSVSLKTCVKPGKWVREELLKGKSIEFDDFVYCNESGYSVLCGSAAQDYFQTWAKITAYVDLDFDWGTPPALRSALRNLWKFCIDTWWSNRFAIQQGDELPCPLQFSVVWGDHSGDTEVDVEWGSVTESDFGEWYVDKKRWKTESPASDFGLKFCMVVVHEYGHYIGLLDEYDDGNPCFCDDSRVTTNPNSIMFNSWQSNGPVPSWHFDAFAGNMGCNVVPMPMNVTQFDQTAFDAQRSALFMIVQGLL